MEGHFYFILLIYLFIYLFKTSFHYADQILQ